MKSIPALPTQPTDQKTPGASVPPTATAHDKTPAEPEMPEENDFSLRAGIKAFYMALKR
ncbi:hypothetical protein [Flavobacterium humi]|uniref:hypothetical protein n=1 Tax=Flavobacterium humi TaxID=2562683 RepID=UPI00146AB733|nr:hypothetical protein [Flavobacterium humi]